MPDQDTEERILNARGYLHLLNSYLQGTEAPDPADTETAEACIHITHDIVDVDLGLADQVFSGGLQMCRLVPSQPMWRKSTVLAALTLSQKAGAYGPEGPEKLDEEIRKLHEEFPDDAFLEHHWYHLIAYRLACETELAHDQGLKTFDRLKGLIGDVDTVTGEQAHPFAHALFIMVCSARAYGGERVGGWYQEMEALRVRFPDHPDVANMHEKATAIMNGALEAAIRERKKQNSPMGKLKRRLFGRQARVMDR